MLFSPFSFKNPKSHITQGLKKKGASFFKLTASDLSDNGNQIISAFYF